MSGERLRNVLTSFATATTVIGGGMAVTGCLKENTNPPVSSGTTDCRQFREGPGRNLTKYNKCVDDEFKREKYKDESERWQLVDFGMVVDHIVAQAVDADSRKREPIDMNLFTFGAKEANEVSQQAGPALKVVLDELERKMVGDSGIKTGRTRAAADILMLEVLKNARQWEIGSIVSMWGSNGPEIFVKQGKSMAAYYRDGLLEGGETNQKFRQVTGIFEANINPFGGDLGYIALRGPNRKGSLVLALCGDACSDANFTVPVITGLSPRGKKLAAELREIKQEEQQVSNAVASVARYPTSRGVFRRKDHMQIL